MTFATRRLALQARKGKNNDNQADSFFERICKAIHQGKLIPVIGDTIRIAHIFDVDDDEDIEHIVENVPDFSKMNIIEELAYIWGQSERVKYPLTDSFRIARVAQFHSLIEDSAIIAKEDYLSFLKHTLLDVAQEIEERAGEREEIAYIEQLNHEHVLSFSEIVAELDFPRFNGQKEDPLHILARLPLKVYLTTSYHMFIEQELEAAGKQPRTRFCFWNTKAEEVPPEFRPQAAYQPDKDKPVVYHLLGIENVPKSMVLSEDDYLDLLWALARDELGESNSGERILPPYLQGELNSSSLLLMGYRLQDWDLRVLFRGLLKTRKGDLPQSTAIQIDIKDQPLVENEEQAKLYLERYFKKASLDVRFSESDDFVQQLWKEWEQWIQGAR